MTWIAPPLPNRSSSARIDYWLRILEVPPNEPGADILRDMATQRLIELRAMPEQGLASAAAKAVSGT